MAPPFFCIYNNVHHIIIIMHLNMSSFPPTHHGFLFQAQEANNDDHHLVSPTSLPSCPPQLFHGGGGGPLMMMMNKSLSFTGIDQELVRNNNKNGDDDLSDDGSHLPGEKKKRLSTEQVKALEKSFELKNRLEPERKIQLAKALGLQPRQIAIWFQNRRARWKTKQLEKDYQVLKKQFDSLKSDNDALQAQNKKLLAQLMALKTGESNNEGVNLKRETECSWSNGSENSAPGNNINNLDLTRTPQQLTSKHLFPTATSSSSTSMRPTCIAQPLQSSSRSDLQIVQDDHQNLYGMFNAIDEPQGYWAWPDQQHQQYH